MTFILTCATDDTVYQISDRRLTSLGCSSPGAVIDEESNKAVVIDGRLAFGYTGIAEIDGVRTDEWLVNLFKNVPTHDLDAAVERIRKEASLTFAGLRPGDRRWLRHAFIGVGWNTNDKDGLLSPMLVTITNAMNAKGEWEPTPAADFSLALNQWNVSLADFAISFHGLALNSQEKKAIWRHVRRVVRHGAPRAAMLRALIDSCLWIARRHSSVGQSLMALCIPKAAVEFQVKTGLAALFTGGPRGNWATFLYVRTGRPSFQQYGPLMAMGGGIATNFVGQPNSGFGAGIGGPLSQRLKKHKVP